MPKLLKCIATLYFLSLAFIAVPLVSARVDYTFSDNFETSDSDFSNWTTIDGHVKPTIETYMDRSYAKLTGGSPYAFSYIGHFSSDKKVVSVVFDFYGENGATTQGAGFMLTDTVPTSSQKPPNDFGKYAFGIWNIGDKYYLLSPLCDYYGGCGLSINSRAIYEVPRNMWNRIQISFAADTVLLKMNDLEREFIYSGTSLPNGIFFGNPEITTNPQTWKSFSIDNIMVEYGDPLDNSYTPLPYFSQKDPAWKDLPYDSASVWAGAEAASIERWGCAITSVAMVLKEYGIKMPNGEEANPDKLNTWLSAQPDGYIGNGLLNWLAISRLARDARENGQAETDLEFVKSYGSPSDELTSGLYPIIDEGGHFVALYDQNDDSYLLNDPNDATRSSRPKSEWIKSVNTYTPSDTDLSYILLVIEEGASLVAKYLDNNVGETYLEEISDDVGNHGSGKYNVVYIAKPSSGGYKLNINNAGPTSSLLKIYSYDTNGKVDMLEQSVSTGSSDWMFSYHSDGTDPQIVELDTTPPTYIGTNNFSGWYNTPQTAVFNFADPNLPSDFVSPTCQIGTEGKNRTCSVSPTVCDKYNNCETFNLTSNPANIDLTPPSPIKHVWGMGMRPFSIVGWSPSRDAVKYIVEWGVDKNSLTNRVYSRDSWAWLPTPKVKQIYIRVIAEDRAGNLSTPSKLEKLNVHPHYWRW